MSCPRVIVAHGFLPFSQSTVDQPASRLIDALESRGLQVDRLRLPIPAHEAPQASFRLLDLETCDGLRADHLIALDFWAAQVRHPQKSLWLGSWSDPLQDLDFEKVLLTEIEHKFLVPPTDGEEHLLDGRHSELRPLPWPEDDDMWRQVIHRLIPNTPGET